MTSSKKVEGSPTAAEAECTICLSNTSKEIGLLRCQHSFCYECIENWSKHENSCPLCKSRFTFIDKVLKQDSSEAATTSSSRTRKPTKCRIKIKRKDQSDYQPSFEQFGGMDFMANFIASLVGSRHPPAGIARNGLYSLPRRFESLFGPDSPTHQRHRRGITRPASHSIRGSLRNSRDSTHRDGSENNPITLIEDEPAVPTHAISSSSRPSARNSVVDLVDLTGDDDDDPSPAVRSSSALPPTITSTAAADTALSVSNNFLSFDSESEFDEDFFPSLVHSEEDDRSAITTSSERSANVNNDIIELSDDEDFLHSVPTNTTTANTLPNATTRASRRSGIMVWCLDCDTFHDKQEVFDNPDYCRLTYNTLQESDGFTDIRTDLPNTATGGIVSTTNTAASHAVNENLVISEESQNQTEENTMQLQTEEHASSSSSSNSNDDSGVVRPKRVVLLEDNEEEELPWIEAHTQPRVQQASAKDSSFSSPPECVEHNSQTSSSSCGMNTEQETQQSDATTASSTSQFTQSSSTGFDHNTSTLPAHAAAVRYSPRIAKRGIAQQQKEENENEELRVPAKRSRGNFRSILG